MKTVLQEIIQWTKENALTIQGQDGIKYTAIDLDEMKVFINDWLKKEKNQIISAYYEGFNSYDSIANGFEYYRKTFDGKDVSKSVYSKCGCGGNLIPTEDGKVCDICG